MPGLESATTTRGQVPPLASPSDLVIYPFSLENLKEKADLRVSFVASLITNLNLHACLTPKQVRARSSSAVAGLV